MSNAPTGAAVLRDRNADPSIDGALRAWRDETDRRRAAFQETAVQHNSEQAERRRRLTRVLLAVGATTGTLAAVAMIAFGQFGEQGRTVAPTFAAAIPSLEAARFDEPDRSVEAQAQASLAVKGDVRSWSQSGYLWLQFDYAGSPVTLHWFDAAHTEVLEPTGCTNRTAAGTNRCYVGRSPKRVQIARNDGAVAGTWTVEACQDGNCTTVGQYAVD